MPQMKGVKELKLLVSNETKGQIWQALSLRQSSALQAISASNFFVHNRIIKNIGNRVSFHHSYGDH